MSPKTTASNNSVDAFINTIDDEQKKQDCTRILDIMKQISWKEPVLWWDSIIWFWSYTYTYSSWRTGEWMRIAFSPRKQYISLYIMPWYHNFYDLLSKLWKHKAWKSCLNIKKLSDVDIKILTEIIQLWYKEMEKLYPE